jgi:hypothetical protein
MGYGCYKDLAPKELVLGSVKTGSRNHLMLFNSLLGLYVIFPSFRGLMS